MDVQDVRKMLVCIPLEGLTVSTHQIRPPAVLNCQLCFSEVFAKPLTLFEVRLIEQCRRWLFYYLSLHASYTPSSEAELKQQKEVVDTCLSFATKTMGHSTQQVPRTLPYFTKWASVSLTANRRHSHHILVSS